MKERALRDKEQQLQAVLDMSPVGILMTKGNSWTISYANKCMATILGSTTEKIADAAFIDFVHPAEIVNVKIDMHKLVTGEEAQIYSERRLIRKDGSEFKGYLAAQALQRSDGTLQGVMVTIDDNSRLLAAEQALNMIVNNYWEIFNTTNDAVFVHDAYTGAIVEANRAVEKIYGYTREEIFVLNVNDMSSGEPPYSLTEAIRWIRKAYEIGPQSYEWLGRKKSGELFWAEVSLSSSNIGGEGRVLSVVRDISDRKAIEKKLQHLSSHDVLTGLYNRSYFEEEFDRIIKGSRYPITVIVADLDGLKPVNDTHGHEAGDQLIRSAAEILAGVFRTDDVVARIGGDEFAVLLVDTDQKLADELIKRVREAEKLFNFKSFSSQVRMSLGSATACDREETANIFSEADKRMYENKYSHRQTGKILSGFTP